VQPGVYAHDDYDFERPSVDLTTIKTLPRRYAPSNYEVYDYPGAYVQKPHGEHYAHVRIDEFGAQFEIARATTNYRGVSVGSTFALEAQPEENDHFNGRYLVINATHSLESTQYESGDTGGAAFRCSFTALSCGQQFRPRRLTPKPFVQGPQTAVVVGPASDEIYTDKYGRVKVQFHWDRRGRKDENSSCWIRVSHPWAGKGWGSVATPRIGQEVIVDFLEGDPDQPIITGRVYNEENQPSFGFPAGAVISGVKSDTHKGAGYNEVSLDDTAGKERVFIHGQYNMDTVVEHDQTTTVHNCRTDRIDVDDSESIGNNQTLHVMANRTKTVDADERIAIGGNRDAEISRSETLTVMLQRTHTVGVNETITVGAAQEITVGGVQAITVGAAQILSAGANQTLSAGSSQSFNAAKNHATNVGKNVSLTAAGDESRTVNGKRETTINKDDTLNVGKNLVIRATDSVSITTGDASLTMKKDGTIVLKGKNLAVEGSGKINLKASSDIVMKGSNILQN
jgi:type VI secretion system secreted protein VgrG